MSNQIVISSGAKVRNLGGVLTATAGVVSSVGYGTANGVATLDANGKVPLSQLPASVVTYLGTWNASTNTPTLANGTGDIGDLYICNVAGTVNFGAGPITFAVGDWVIYNGSQWQKSAGSSGTVTSVAMTVPTGLSVTGSPITTSGTLALSLASGYTIPTTSFLSGLVPYTGATGNVNLGEYGLSGGYLGLDTTPTLTPTTLGTLSWDDTYLTPKVITGTGATTLQVGQEEVVLIHNNTGSTLTDGQVVYINGSTGNLPTVALADASSETTSAATLGVVTESITNGSNGFITISGNVNGLNTTGYTAGDILWLSETAGQFTNVKPVSPAHLVLIGYVVKVSGGNGSILVKIQNTQELEECSDVLFTSLANNDILAYESSTDLWKNKTIANVLGYTPANDSLVVHLAGNETITGSKTFSAATEFTSSQSVAFNYGLGIAKGNTPSIFSSSAVYLYSASGDNNLIIKDNTNTSKLQFQAASSYTYTFPASTGTVALTSDIPSLTGYVPYTGATSSLNLGNYGLTASSVFVSSVGTNAGQVQLKQGSVFTTPNGYGTFGSGGANDFYFYQNTSSVVRGAILSLGSITASATRTYTLPDADGTLALTSQIPSLSGYVQGSGTTNYISKFTASGTIGDSLLFDNGTNIGIGNTTPSYKFDVNGTGRYTGNLMVSSPLGFAIGDITSYQRIQHNAGTFSFLTSANGNASITAGGATFSSSVGIGNTSPSYTLDVTGTGRFTGPLNLTGTASDTNQASGAPFIYLQGGGSSFTTIQQAVGKLSFWQFNGSIFVNTFNITNAGNVGIGTSSPSTKLHISNAGDVFSQVSNTSKGNGYFGCDSTGIAIGSDTSSVPLYFFTNSGGGPTERMRITSGGSLCVGRTSAPSSAYSAAFQEAVAMYVGTNGNNIINWFNASGTYVCSIVINASSVAYNTSSDYRLKQDLKDYNGLSIINAIKTYDFEWKIDNSRMHGVIAHELQEVLPYAVSGEKDAVDKDGNIKNQGVDYSKLVPVLIKAIQELKAEIDELKNK